MVSFFYIKIFDIFFSIKFLYFLKTCSVQIILLTTRFEFVSAATHACIPKINC